MTNSVVGCGSYIFLNRNITLWTRLDMGLHTVKFRSGYRTEAEAAAASALQHTAMHNAE